jgi:5-carboxymethyl-2-hydroxymuconate isomerase
MSRYNDNLFKTGVILTLAGLAVVFFALTHSRSAGADEVDQFVHDYFSMSQGLPYEDLFHHAAIAKMQVAALTTTLYAVAGTSTLILGLTIVAFSKDRYIDLFGRKKEPVTSE